jgi:uncharacterized protein YndB with AHSA1/START domain
MNSNQKNTITVNAIINVPVEKAWQYWTTPDHIIKWNNANDEWHTPHAENDLRVGGKFLARMEAKDGSMGFDFEGIYDAVKPHELIQYSLADGRVVKVEFKSNGSYTEIIETFDPENMNSHELQRMGWQAILDNFKKYTEAS